MKQEAELDFRTLSLFLSLAVSLSLQYSWRGLLTFCLFRYAGVTASINEFAQVVASRIVSKVEASTRAGMTDSGLYVIIGALVQASKKFSISMSYRALLTGIWLWRIGIPVAIMFAIMTRRACNHDYFELKASNRLVFSPFTEGLNVQRILEIVSNDGHPVHAWQHVAAAALISVVDLAGIQFFSAVAIAARLRAGEK
jgi:hypothetical protein